MKRKFTPENIENLKSDEVFVFGSNMNGNHAGGAARVAVEKFGAVMGQAEGMQGQSYAIPTLGKDMRKVGMEELAGSIKRFARFASENLGKTFYLTKIGCGIAGFSEGDLALIIKDIDMPENVALPIEFTVIKSYKAFDKDFQCRDFQYEVGQEYEMNDDVECCKRGFHACESPMEIWDYYNMLESRFAEVEQSGSISKEQGSTKICSSKIKIKAELKLIDIINIGVEWLKDMTDPKNIKVDDISNSSSDSAKIGSSGDYAQIGSSGYSARIGSSGHSAQIGSSGDSAKIGSSGDYAKIGSSGHSAKIGSSSHSAQIGSSGDWAKIGSSGNDAQIGSSGDSARIGSSGDSAKIGSSGDDAQIGSSGDSAKIGSSGDSAKIGSSGDWAKIGSSGDSAKIGSSGDYAKIGSSGNDAQIGSSGDSAQIGSSGNDAQIGSSGDSAQIGSSGDSAKIGSSGDSAQIDCTGEDSVVMCAGNNSAAKAKKGSWITLSEWEYDRFKGRHVPVCVKTEFVDGKIIKEDTWYRLEGGEFREVEL